MKKIAFVSPSGSFGQVGGKLTNSREAIAEIALQFEDEIKVKTKANMQYGRPKKVWSFGQTLKMSVMTKR